jgi:hypothetical protein
MLKDVLSLSRKAAMEEDMKELDPHTIRPCLACGCTSAHLESMLPPGRKQEVWRVVCSCGQTSQQWSVSQGAAIRAWNRNLASSHDYILTGTSHHNTAKS